MASTRIRSYLWRKGLLLKKTRYKAGSVGIHGQRFRYIDWPSFVHQYHDIWVREVYRLPVPKDVRTILDCGVNVGTSMSYFLSKYPNAFVYGWEADASIAHVASDNLSHFPANRYQIEASAVWIENGKVAFCSDKADAGSTVLGGVEAHTVPAVRLRDHILKHDKIDLLKMDIEGAEFEVLHDIVTVLNRIESLFVEVHLNDSLSPRFPTLLQSIQDAGFTVRIEAVGSLGPAPFVKEGQPSEFDSQMNMFCKRKDS